MSKLMGKIFLRDRKEGEFGAFDVVFKGLSVRYLKSKDAFEFKGLRLSKADQEAELAKMGMSLADIGEGFEECRVVVSSAIMSAMIMADKVDKIIYHWSVGYMAREKLGNRPGDFKLLADRESEYIAKIVGDSVAGGFDFDSYVDLSVWQYLFNISETILKMVKVLWKKRKWNRGNVSSCWLQLAQRNNFGGRVLGAKGLEHKIDYSESETDFKERIAHNKKVAVAKGYLGWYIDSCKEECKRFSEVFDKDKCLETWQKLREGM